MKERGRLYFSRSELQIVRMILLHVFLVLFLLSEEPILAGKKERKQKHKGLEHLCEWESRKN